MTLRLLVDAREFVPGKKTGIGRFLGGLVDALLEYDSVTDVNLVVGSNHDIPSQLNNHNKTSVTVISTSCVTAEKTLSKLGGRDFALFISPYRKLPILGTRCPSVHTIHDVLDLTHDAYRHRLKRIFDGFRLKSALKQARLTWYDSEWSLRETEKCIGYVGKNPRVRYLAIDERFTEQTTEDDDAVLKKHHLRSGYIIVVGNGLPHKNLGVLLSTSGELSRQFVFVGVPEEKQKYWRSEFRRSGSSWISHVDDEDLPALIRRSFCLAQPSTAEGYGYPPLEAMACGVPAVVSNIPVLVETTGGHALTADPTNAHAWIEAFDALEKREVYQAQVEKSLRWVQPLRGSRGWEKHIADIEGFIKDL